MHRDACCQFSESLLLGIVVQIEAACCINLGCIIESNHGSQKERKPDAVLQHYSTTMEDEAKC